MQLRNTTCADGDMLTLTTLYPHNMLCGHTTCADGDTLTVTTLYPHDMLCGHTTSADGDMPTLTSLYPHMLCTHTTSADRYRHYNCIHMISYVDIQTSCCLADIRA